MIELTPLTEEVAIAAAEWRNYSPESCRTDKPSTVDTQKAWFARLEDSKDRVYWTVESDGIPVGIGGLTSLTDWSGEISIVLDPKARGKGIGKAAVDLLIEAGLGMGLKVIYGEVYKCNPALHFWHHILEKYSPKWSWLPNRKMFQGDIYDSEYFSIRR